jgi:hypothetical protein
MANNISYSSKPISTNDADLWVEYPWSSVVNPYPPVTTTPSQGSLSYLVLRLSDVTDRDSPKVVVNKNSVPVWLTDAAFTIVGSPKLITGSNSVKIDAATVVCGAASFTRTVSTVYLVIPQVYVPITAGAPDFKSEGYISYVSNKRDTSRQFSFDTDAFVKALVITLIIVFVVVFVTKFGKAIWLWAKSLGRFFI